MAKSGLQCLAASLFIVLSSASYGITSICSGEFLPLTGQYTLKHEAAWSDYDNWFSDMYAEVYTAVDGTQTSTLSEEYVMGSGGGVLHYVERPSNGDYKVAGHVRTGYPKDWGFDGYFGVGCPLWTGRIENEPTADEGATDHDAVGVLAVALKNAAQVACDASAIDQCPAVVGASPGTSDSSNPPQQESSTEAKTELTLGMSVTGVIQSVDQHALVLITRAGQYVTLELPARLDITRHTYVNLKDLAPDSVVGAILGKSEKNETEIVHFRQYRNVSKESALSSAPPATDRAGFELRGVLKSITRNAEGSTMRLVHAKGEANLPVSAHVFVTIVDSAQLSELKPFRGRARVVAELQEDGSLLASKIEILQ